MKIVFIEGSVSGAYSPNPLLNLGGSSVSLSLLVNGLDKGRFESLLLFSYPSVVAEDLRAAGFRVLIPAGKPPKPGPKKAVSSLAPSRIYAALSFHKHLILRMLPEARRLSRLFRNEKPDLVHANMSLVTDLAPIIAARLAGIPCVCHLRAFGGLYPVHKICSRFVSVFICISEAIRRDFLRQGIPAAKLHRVYNGVDLDHFRPPLEDSRPEDEFTVVQIGRMVAWKGQEVFLRAATIVRKNNPRVRFILAGDGPDREALTALAAGLGIDQEVRFTGTVKDIRPLLAASDVVVLPSLEPEPFGRVVIEAMAMGRPVIASDLGGPREIISPPRDGLLVGPGDPVRLAEAIGLLLDDGEKRKAMGRAARETAERRFDARTTVREIEEIYRQAAGG